MNNHKSVCQLVRCSNCGSHAERLYLSDSNLTKTECHACDSLIITCSLTGKVIENYMTNACAKFTHSYQEHHDSCRFSFLEKPENISLSDLIIQSQSQRLIKYEPTGNARVA